MKNLTYILLAKQQANTTRVDRISDNIANASTTGFKAEHDLFKTFVLPSKKDSITFNQFRTTLRDTNAGGMQITKRALDVAIHGKGFFKVQTPNGERFTRAGDFVINSEGQLANKDGYIVMGAGGGGVNFLPEDTEISIREDGTVFSGPDERGRIGMFSIEDEQAMQRTGQNLLKSEDPGVVSTEATLEQGMLETSNVNTVTEMTSLIDASRDYEQINAILRRYRDLQADVGRRLVQTNA